METTNYNKRMNAAMSLKTIPRMLVIALHISRIEVKWKYEKDHN
jgi:hypothetical protein